MNGPEHYLKAEQLLADAAASKETTFEGHNPEADRTIAAAQVHATLALAAATAQGALTGSTPDGLEGMSARDVEAWNAAAGGEG